MIHIAEILGRLDDIAKSSMAFTAIFIHRACFTMLFVFIDPMLLINEVIRSTSREVWRLTYCYCLQLSASSGI